MKYQKQSGQGNVIDAALAKIRASPLVGLAEEIPYIHTDNSCPMSKDDWGYVTSSGHIFLNPRKDGTIGEWTYVLAHLMLHLGLGHLQEDRIHDSVWQQACDIAVTRFLLDGRIGTPPMDVSGILNTAAADEEKLYRQLLTEPNKQPQTSLSLMSHGTSIPVVGCLLRNGSLSSHTNFSTLPCGMMYGGKDVTLFYGMWPATTSSTAGWWK